MTPTPTSGAADLPEALRIANVLDLAKQIDYYNHVQDDLEAAAAELRRLHALTTQQQRDLIAESHRTAEQKLRADQMTTQHAHQAALNTEARAQLAAALTAQAISKAPDHVAEVGNMVEQAISAEQAGVPAATVIKRGADREWMSERLGHLPDGVYSLYLAAPQPSPSPAPAQPVHVQNSPENEHVADDVSKSERESNMTAQPGQEGELLQLAKAYKEYIDALPADVVAALPAMPGVDGDWASEVLDRATRAAPQPAPPADSVQEDAAWMPLTPELLTAIESGDLGNRFWIAAHNNNEPQIGVYEWRQGRNPHGFNSDLGRYGASEITHVLPYKPPALPAARKQGANHD